MSVLKSKFKDVVMSVLPISLLVVILHFTIVPLEGPVFGRFILGSVSLILGLTIFLLGVDIGITPIGIYMGKGLARSNKLSIVVIASLILGFSISVAEPDLHILAGQVMEVTSGVIDKMNLVVIVSIGLAFMVMVGLVRIIKNIKLRMTFIITYLLILVAAIFSFFEFHAIAFDASGSTTGAMTVPFILALAVGVASLKRDSESAEEDSFGLLGLASAGVIFSVLLYSIVTQPGDLSGSLGDTSIQSTHIFRVYFSILLTVSKEIVLALLPIVFFFFLYQILYLKAHAEIIRRIIVGLIYTFVGLVLFLTGVNAGFMDVGKIIGQTIATQHSSTFTVLIGFIFGVVTILAEPAVHVLTHQIEEVTNGYVRRPLVLLALSIGVGLSVSLSVIRIMSDHLELWHFLLPGYMISLMITFLVPELFVGIAFDSGGVASGPMTATFILSFAMGVAEAMPNADVLVDGFGIIAMVAMTPLIALQLLGIVFKMKSRKEGL